MYFNSECLIKFQVLDAYGNLIQQIDNKSRYDLTIEHPDKNVSNTLQWEMRNSTVSAPFFPKVVGKRQMILRFADKELRSKDTTCTYEMPINILSPPCSPILTLKNIDSSLIEQHCSAGKEFTIHVKLYDIFGNVVSQGSNQTCDIIGQVHPFKAALLTQQRHERVRTVKINTSEDSTVAVTVCFQIPGPRRAILVANSLGCKSSSKDICVTVHPPIPHHLDDVRFATHGVVDESFSPDPTVMYKNQWSTLEAQLIDYHGSVVKEEGNKYDIGLMLCTGSANETEMEYKDAEIQGGVLRIQLKISQAGKHNLLLRLARSDFPDDAPHSIQVQIHVNDPPLYLAGCKFHYPDHGVAGKEIEIEILPYDVFGSPWHPSSSDGYNLIGRILSPFSERKDFEETLEFKVVNTESNIVILVSVLLKIASRRKLMIFEDKDMERNRDTHLQCKKNLSKQ